MGIWTEGSYQRNIIPINNDKINVFLPEMLCIVVLAAENDELQRFEGFTSSFSAVDFFAVVARSQRETFYLLRFVEDMNTEQQFSFSFPELSYSSRKNCHYLSNWTRWN